FVALDLSPVQPLDLFLPRPISLQLLRQLLHRFHRQRQAMLHRLPPHLQRVGHRPQLPLPPSLTPDRFPHLLRPFLQSLRPPLLHRPALSPHHLHTSRPCPPPSLRLPPHSSFPVPHHSLPPPPARVPPPPPKRPDPCPPWILPLFSLHLHLRPLPLPQTPLH